MSHLKLAKALRTLSEEYSLIQAEDSRVIFYTTSNIYFTDKEGNQVENLFTYTCHHIADVLKDMAYELERTDQWDPKYIELFELVTNCLESGQPNTISLNFPTATKYIQLRAFNTNFGWVIYAIQNGLVNEIEAAVAGYCKDRDTTPTSCFLLDKPAYT